MTFIMVAVNVAEQAAQSNMVIIALKWSFGGTILELRFNFGIF